MALISFDTAHALPLAQPHDRDTKKKKLAARNSAGRQPLKNDPAFDPVRGDARFAERLRRTAVRLAARP